MILCGLVLLLGSVRALASNSAEGAISYPLFKQCDPLWADEKMGIKGDGERATICREGCAMSCLSMALNGLGVTLPTGDTINPGSLNSFLVNNSMFICMDGDCNLVLLRAPETLTGLVRFVSDEYPAPSSASISAGLAAGNTIYLAHVQNQTHFVLLTGTASPGVFTVNDPFFNLTTYTYADIYDVLVYQILPSPRSDNIPKVYPLYKQCDPRWANNIMEPPETICDVGCLMSSISMAINGWNISISGQTSDPATLNEWLRDNNGYTSGSDLEEDVVPNIDPARIIWPLDGMHTTNDLPLDTIRGLLIHKRVVIANVMHGEHFVLVTGFSYSDPDMLYVNDPGFNTTTYSYSNDVVGWRLFHMKP